MRGYRSLLDVSFRPGPLTALVGEARAGKSNTLSAVRALLDPAAAPIRPEDAARRDGRVSIHGRLADGTAVWAEVDGRGPSGIELPPVLFMPAALRSGPVVDMPAGAHPPASGPAGTLAQVLRDLAAHRDGRRGSDAVAAQALVSGIEACCDSEVTGAVVLIEEPELFLRPHAQRYLYRLLRALASAGNQVMYSTHSPTFLNVARLEEFALVGRAPETGTTIIQPPPLAPGEEFRAMSEFDAERGELFLSQAAILVEGRTEKLALPFVFRAMGHDADREAISIVECGGKANIPLFVGICHSVGVPCVVLHDRDAPAGMPPSEAEDRLNALIREAAGAQRTVELVPDFEGVAGLRGHSRKPERAWRRFASLRRDRVPEPLAGVVELALSLARGGQRSGGVLPPLSGADRAGPRSPARRRPAGRRRPRGLPRPGSPRSCGSG